MRARQDRLEGSPHAVLERPVFGTGVVEQHQAIDIIGRGRATVRVGHQVRDDLSGAALLFAGRGRAADEDGAPAGRIGHPGRVEGPTDDQIPQMRQRRDACTPGPAACQRPVVRPDQIFVRALGLPDERDGHPVLSGPKQDGVGPQIDAPREPPIGQRRDVLTIDRHVEVVEAGVPPRAEGHLEEILAVCGEDVVDNHPAARPERSTLDPIPRMLRDVLSVGVGPVDRRCVGIADRQEADLGRRVQVGLQQRRRERLGVRDVVEVLALGVERQPISGVHFERQEVVDHARVLGAVEPREGLDAGVRIHSGRGVDPVLQRLHQSQQRVGSRSRPARRRHHACPQLADHPLARLSRLVHPLHGERLHRQVAGQHHVVVAALAVLPDDGRQFFRGQIGGLATIGVEAQCCV